MAESVCFALQAVTLASQFVALSLGTLGAFPHVVSSDFEGPCGLGDSGTRLFMPESITQYKTR